MPEVQPFAADPEAAIAFLRDKTELPTETWTDIWQEMHSRAFVVAGANTDAIVADFHDAVSRAIAEGRTIEQFREDFDRIVAAHGWSYNGGRGWRSRVIFETNLRSAYNAGRWKEAQDARRTRPWLRYVAVMDERTRPEHAAWHDTVLHIDDPWWDTHFPPNGWGCRCTVQSLNDRDLKRYGLTPAKQPPPGETEQRTVNTPRGPVTVTVPVGIDPGFAYNPGLAASGRGPQSLAIERHGPFLPLIAPGAPAPRGLPPLPVDRATRRPLDPDRDMTEDKLRAILREALDGRDEAILEDPAGGHVLLGQAIVDHFMEDAARRDGRERYLPLLPELVTNPAEIWIGFAQSEASGRVALRRRYVKLVDIGGGRTLGLVADADGRVWSGYTFFISRDRRGSKNLRSGALLWRRAPTD